MNTIECFKCDKCGTLLPKDTSEYLIINNLKITSHEKSKTWDKGSYWNKLLIEYQGIETLFCSLNCINNYLKDLYEEK